MQRETVVLAVLIPIATANRANSQVAAPVNAAAPAAAPAAPVAVARAMRLLPRREGESVRSLRVCYSLLYAVPLFQRRASRDTTCGTAK